MLSADKHFRCLQAGLAVPTCPASAIESGLARHRSTHKLFRYRRIFVPMRSLARISAFFLGLALAQPLLAQTSPIKIVGLVELSGTGATSGTNFNDGVKLAVKEINAAGGILGRKVEYTSSDTQSQPQVSKALVVKAIDDGAYIVMGPVFSGSIMVSMAETRRAEIPNFTGGEAAAITQQGNPYIFRTSFTQSAAMPKVARYLKDNLKANTVAIIYTNN